MADKKYLPSHKRVAEPPPMRLTARDKQIVTAVYEHRLLSAHQIEALLFPSTKRHSKRTVCQRRLQLLYHHGFLDRLPSPMFLGEGRSPYVYVLDKLGVDLVASLTGVDRSDIGWKPSRNEMGVSFINHTQAINDVRIVLMLMMKVGHFTLGNWFDEADFRRREFQERVPYQQRGARVERKFPDGYFQLHQPDYERPSHFFLEIDTGTMSNQRWREKVVSYYQFRQSGLSQKHYGTRNFRLLTVTNSQARLNNLKATTERAEGDHYFWFTTADKVDIWQPDRFLEPIWEVATQTEKRPLLL